MPACGRLWCSTPEGEQHGCRKPAVLTPLYVFILSFIFQPCWNRIKSPQYFVKCRYIQPFKTWFPLSLFNENVIKGCLFKLFLRLPVFWAKTTVRTAGPGPSICRGRTVRCAASGCGACAPSASPWTTCRTSPYTDTGGSGAGEGRCKEYFCGHAPLSTKVG